MMFRKILTLTLAVAMLVSPLTARAQGIPAVSGGPTTFSANGAITVNGLNGQSWCVTYAEALGGGSLFFEGSNDGTFTQTTPGVPATNAAGTVIPGGSAATAAGFYYSPAPIGSFRARLVYSSGSPKISVFCYAGGSAPVTSTSSSTITSPVDGSGNVKTAPQTSTPAGANVIGSTGSTSVPNVGQLVDGTTPTQKVAVSAGGALKVDGSAVTQPVSGTVTANAGTGNFSHNLAQVNGSTVAVAATGQQKVAVCDPTTIAQCQAIDASGISTVKFGSAQAVNATLQAASTTNVGFTGTTTNPNVGQLVDGTTPTQKAAVSAGGALKVDNSAVTQPVSGTVQIGNTPNTTSILAANCNTGASPTCATVGAGNGLRVETTGGIATYNIAPAVFTTPAGGAPFFQLQGSGTKTIKIRRILIAATAGSAASATIRSSRLSTTTTGGTSASVTINPFDTTNAASTAAALTWTVAGALGTSIGNLYQQTISVTTGTTPGDTIKWDLGVTNEQPIVLRGTSEFFQMNSSAAITISLFVVWTEE